MYEDEELKMATLAVGVKKLQIAFPKMEQGFFDLLTERIIVNEFTEKRLCDAVEHVLDNFQYKELNIADIIKFDRRVKLYTTNQIWIMTGQTPHPETGHPDFDLKVIDGKRYFYRKVDLLNSNL